VTVADNLKAGIAANARRDMASAEASHEAASPRLLSGGEARSAFASDLAGGTGTVGAWQGLERWSLVAAAVPGSNDRGAVARRVALTDGWRFGPAGAADWDQPGLDETGFEDVAVPHTVAHLSWRDWEPASWEREFCYRRRFELPDSFAGLRTFVDFAGALTKAAVHLNGVELGVHLGGYLPFRYEITDMAVNGENLLAVLLDASFDLNVPPNVPSPGTNLDIDFWEPGGIYRDVCVRAVPQVFIDDVFAKPVDVLSAEPAVEVECTLDTSVPLAGQGMLTVEILDPDDGRRLGSATTVPLAASAGRSTVQLRIWELSEFTLWDINQPKLYDVVATLVWNGQALHQHRTRVGFREARFDAEGFFLNGRRVKLFGVNRHQHYPFAGFAMSDRVQRRDAEILRSDLNCNMVRCSHYPQSAAFLDACDELGLLVWEEPPGWQYLGNDAWRELACRDVAEMVRRDRNRPSIVIWAPRLNETADDSELYTRTEQLVKQLDDSRQTAGATHGQHYASADYQHEVFAYDDYTTYYDGADRYPLLMPPRTDMPYLISESISWRSSPSRGYRRTDPVAYQQIQALAHAIAHDKVAGDHHYAGLLAWSAIDYYSGFRFDDRGIKRNGLLDVFRVPKLGAAIYRAQVEPDIRPVIEPAFYFDRGPASPDGPGPRAMVCSNCEHLEVYLDGTHLATVRPDRARFPHLAYPPSFVDLTVNEGLPELRIDGYVGGRLVLSRTFASDPAGDRLLLQSDDDDLVADGADTTRVMIAATDRYGSLRPFTEGDVYLEVSGPGLLVGESPFALADAGGAGAVWIRTLAGQAGTIRLLASHARLGTAPATLVSRLPRS
jgi:beta-galactosidase